MNTLTFVRDKEWIDQAKAYIYDALRFLGIRYKWKSKEHIQIDDDHVIKFIIKKDFSPTTYENEKGKFIRQLGYTIKLPQGTREDNDIVEIEDLSRILGNFLNLDKYMSRDFYNNKLQYRDELLYNIKENKKEYRKLEVEMKRLNCELKEHKDDLQELMEDR